MKKPIEELVATAASGKPIGNTWSWFHCYFRTAFQLLALDAEVIVERCGWIVGPPTVCTCHRSELICGQLRPCRQCWGLGQQNWVVDKGLAYESVCFYVCSWKVHCSFKLPAVRRVAGILYKRTNSGWPVVTILPIWWGTARIRNIRRLLSRK